jgi:hypothetical protein
MSSHDERPEFELPDSALGDSAMASGSDAGEPGEHLGPASLDADERRLLEALEADTTAAEPDPPELLILEERAAEDEAPLPDHGGPQRDGLEAQFSDPEDRLPE